MKAMLLRILHISIAENIYFYKNSFLTTFGKLFLVLFRYFRIWYDSHVVIVFALFGRRGGNYDKRSGSFCNKST